MSSDNPEPPMPVETALVAPKVSRIDEVRKKVSAQRKIQPEQIGLKVWYQPDEVEDIEIDVVAIHGIGAHPEYTWNAKNKVNWLKDSTMLPAALPNARILAFGYESFWFGENALRISLRSVATGLLNALREARSECPNRPIIFIGHCFGGLVALHSYMISTILKISYPGISDSVAGMVFLGTPFIGLSHDSGMTTMGDVYVAIAKSEVRVQDNVMKTVAQDNDVLVTAVSEFARFLGNLSGSAKPKLFCFFEQKESDVGSVAGITDLKPKFLVTESSGVLSGHENEGLPLDHFQINKFANADDGSYIAVCREILTMSKNAKALSEGKGSILPGQIRTTSLPHPSKHSMQSPVGPTPKEKNFAARNGILNSIEEKFLKTPYVALYGESGNGKTHIAQQYASKFLDESRKHVYWVNASSAAEFELSYKRIAEALGISRESMDDDEVLEAVSEALSRDSSGGWLMILDGCDDRTKLKVGGRSGSKRSLLDYVPKKGLFVRVLITTRSKSQATRMAGPDPEFAIKVPTLDDADASFLLLGKDTADSNKMQKTAARAKQLGGSAGTLVMARLYQNKTSVLPKAYMERFHDSSTNDASKTMRAWQLLYQLMKQKHGEAARLLLDIGSMDVQCVPYALFNRDELWEKAHQLAEYGMAEVSAERMVVTVTPLVRKCVQEHLDEDEDEDRETVEERVLSRMREKFHGNERRTAEPLLPCALAVLKFQRVPTEARLDLARLQSEVAKFYGHAKRHRLAIEHWEQVISLCEEDPENSDGLLREARQARKEARGRLDLTDSSGKGVAKTERVTETVTNRVVQKRGHLLELERVKGADHPDTIRTADELAMTQLIHGDPSDARDSVKLYRRVLDWCEVKQGIQSIDFARQQYNLALSLERQEEYVQAEELYRSASRTVALHLGPGHPEVLKIYASLACMYCRQGRWGDAERIFQSTLLGQQKALGPDHPDTLLTRQNIAMMWGHTGKADDAVDELRHVLAVQLQLLGHDNPAPYRTARCLAINYGWQGSPDKAEGLLRESLGIQKQLFGDMHPDTARTQLTLRELLDQMETSRA